MKKIAIMINEEGLTKAKAPLGQHATLAYICAVVSEGHEVYLIDHSQNSFTSCIKNSSFPAIKLNQTNFGKFPSLYQVENEKLVQLTRDEGAKVLASNGSYGYDQDHLVADRKISRVRDHIISNKKLDDITMADVSADAAVELRATDLQNMVLLNRIDPMLASFLPEDRAAAEKAGKNVYQYCLEQYKTIAPSAEFSDPSGKCDKVAPVEVDEARAAAGLDPIYTPTFNAKIDDFDKTLSDSVEKTLLAEGKLFPRSQKEFADQPQRIAFKPIDSAQSSGVCGMEFCPDGLNLSQLKRTPIMTLINEDLQLLRVQNNLDSTEIKEMARILLYVQALKEKYPEASKGTVTKPADLNELRDTEELEMNKVAKTLYETEILVQPFLVGVAKMGDVRVNLVADKDGVWSSVGHTFRAQISKQGAAEEQKGNVTNGDQIVGTRFTTCFSAGKAAPTRVEYKLTETECDSLNKCVDGLLWALNGTLKNSYSKCQELGVDFVPVGDNRSFTLGEINHTDPALAPVSAALRKGCFDLANNLQPKSEAEHQFSDNYKRNHAQEKEFAENYYRGGLGPMITSLQNAIARHEEKQKTKPNTASSVFSCAQTAEKSAVIGMEG